MICRPLAAMAVMTCCFAAFLVELHLAPTTTAGLGAFSAIGLAGAVTTRRSPWIRPLAAVVMSCWLVSNLPPVWTGTGQPFTQTGRVEGMVVRVSVTERGTMTVVVDGEIDLRSCPATRCRAVIRCPRMDALVPGCRMVAFATVEPVQRPVHPSMFDARAWASGMSVTFAGRANAGDVHVIAAPSVFMRNVSSARRWVAATFAAHLPDRHAPILTALVIGGRVDIDRDTLNAFAQSGVAHILSVSGSHVGVILTILVSLLGPLSRSRVTSLVGLCILAAYAVVTGAEPPTVRACLMAAAVVVALVRERQYDLVNLLGAATLIVLLIDPTTFTRSSFMLSSVATYGIIILHPAWMRRLRLPPSMRSMFALNLSASSAIALPAALLTNSVALLAPAANVVIVPLMSVAMVAGIVLLPIGSFVPSVAGPIVWCISACMDLAIGSVKLVADLTPSFDQRTTIVMGFLVTVAMAWPAYARDVRGLAVRSAIAICWLGIGANVWMPKTEITIMTQARELFIATEHERRVRVIGLTYRYGAIFVRSRYDSHPPSLSPRRTSQRHNPR